MSQQTEYDFFISYTGHDQAWAEWIAWQLRSSGYKTILQAWDFGPGSDFIHKMDDAIQNAERLIAVLSPNYVQSKFSEAEWRPYFKRDPTGDLRLLVPVRVATFEPRGLWEARVYIDLSNVTDKVQARATLLEGIAGKRAPAQEPHFPPDLLTATEQPHTSDEPRLPSIDPEICNLPHRNPQFTGRTEELERLRASLRGSTNGVQIQALYGHPGVGKTQLALEYAHRYAPDYDLVWWIPAETVAAIPAAMIALAANFKPPLPKTDQLDQQAVVAAVSDNLSRRNRWLLIFDNATEPNTLAPYVPTRGSGQVLITSRNPNWQEWVGSPFKVDLLPAKEAEQFLLRRTGTDDEGVARQLADELGNLPLALEQAAAYMSENAKPLSEYLALFRRTRGRLLELGDPIDYTGTVDTTVQMAVDRLTASPPAVVLLPWCAFMAPEKILLNVFTKSKQIDLLPVEMRSIAQDEIELDKAIGVLHRSSLITRGEGVLNLHRLVQDVIRRHLTPADYQTWAELTIRLLLDSFPSSIDDLAAPSHWPRCEQLLSHIFAATEYAQDAKVTGATVAELLMHAGSYLQHRGEYVEARRLFERALTLAETAHGPDDLEVAHVLNALGYVVRTQGDAAQAQKYHERALRIIKTTLPPDHAEVGSTLNNIGRALYDQKDLAGARINFEQALAISRVALGANHPEVASVLNNLGRIFYEEGDLAKAGAAHEQALAIKEAASGFGPDHPSVGATLGALGRVLLAQRDFDAARITLERALKIQESALREQHPDLVVTLEVLSKVRDALGDHEGAKTAREQAQTISHALLAAPRCFRLQVD